MARSDNLSTVKWLKSSLSNGQGVCVEVAEIGDEIAVRDSKNPNGPHLRFARSEIAAWIAGCKAGEFDDLT